ncbi:MAG: T9SS type A sorting domain-containing protein [Ginsengibacter sp.]
MKSIFTIILSIFIVNVSAQWSDTHNQFYDSLHMAVCTATGEQLNSIVVKSFPDSGYFVIWEDHRISFYGPTQIFAQKFDKTGNQLWAVNGLPVSSGINSQHYYNSTNADYRNYSYAATDSAGGMYIAYADDSTATYIWERAMVQHIKSDGSLIFPGAGNIIAISNTPNAHVNTQLIADGNKGFFIGLMQYTDLYVFCFKDNGGILQYYGGSDGVLNKNAFLVQQLGNCGIYNSIVYPATSVLDYKIYPDLQKGCNIAMTMSQNAGGSDRVITGYNWLWRAKQNATAPNNSFLKDSVAQYFNLDVRSNTIVCGSDPNVYTYTNYSIVSLGFGALDNLAYDAQHIKGAVVPTDGNMNVNVYAVNKRIYLGNNQLTNWFTQIIVRPQEKFTDIPYAYFTGPYYKPTTIFTGPPPGQNKLGTYTGQNNDTLIYDPSGSYFYDFCLETGGNEIYASAPVGNGGTRNVLLQNLQIDRVTSDSFALRTNTNNKSGVVIGKESYYTSYGQPQITVDNNGNGVFYVAANSRSNRVSPIVNGSELLWGAMGKPTGSGLFQGAYYTPNDPFMAIDPSNGTALLSWYDDRRPPNTGNNIFMRHLDSLNVSSYFPPYKAVKQLVNYYGATPGDPTVLLGSSHHYTTIEASNGLTSSPVVEILDTYNLGNVAVSVYENLGAIRTFNGNPYLDRNYTITPDNNPNGAATINVRLFFTQAEFDALKAAVPSVVTPGDLSVIKQPASGSAPATYSFVPGETQVFPQSWAAVPGGYYIEIAITSFSNFYIQSPNAALPLTWLGIQAQWQNISQAKVSWQVAAQQSVSKFTVQKSTDGNSFEDDCITNATAQTKYTCIVTAPENKNYFRVRETDKDGRISFSPVAILQKNGSNSVSISPNPAKNILHVINLRNYTSYQIIDIRGKIIQHQNILSGVQDISITMLSSGLYLIKLMNYTEIKTLKFIKE